MKHKHYDMIVAKVANMDLVSFLKWGDRWELTPDYPNFHPANEYFLCLPQHKEAVLHALNGSQSQATNEVGEGNFQDVYVGKPDIHWTSGGWYMSDKCESRIKPKKEKRWILYDVKNGKVALDVPLKTYDEAALMSETVRGFLGCQVIEIEVEI